MASGIRHLCDEKIKDSEFQYFLNNLETFAVTEKVDGTNLTFGLDDRGDFFINRDKKDGRKFGNIYQNTKNRLGPVFSKYFDILFKFNHTGAIRLSRNSSIEIEIIDDPITNVVPYDPRQFIILNEAQGYIEIYKDEIEAPAGSGQMWAMKFNRPYKIDADLIRNIFLEKPRAEALVEMKKQLLDIPSQYGVNNPDSWIEGLVFRKGDLIYKLVNKDRFTVMNKFLHEERAKISAPKPSVNSVGGLYQEMIAEIARYYDCEPVATSQRSRWNSQNPEWAHQVQLKDTLFYNQNLLMVKGIIEKYSKKLSELYEEYIETYQDKNIVTQYGTCYIDQYTHAKNVNLYKSTAEKIRSIVDDIHIHGPNSTGNLTSLGLIAIRW